LPDSRPNIGIGERQSDNMLYVFLNVWIARFIWYTSFGPFCVRHVKVHHSCWLRGASPSWIALTHFTYQSPHSWVHWPMLSPETSQVFCLRNHETRAYHIGTLQCAVGYGLRNRHNVLYHMGWTPHSVLYYLSHHSSFCTLWRSFQFPDPIIPLLPQLFGNWSCSSLLYTMQFLWELNYFVWSNLPSGR
jgi:hypothetical protein